MSEFVPAHEWETSLELLTTHQFFEHSPIAFKAPEPVENIVNDSAVLFDFTEEKLSSSTDNPSKASTERSSIDQVSSLLRTAEFEQPADFDISKSDDHLLFVEESLAVKSSSEHVIKQTIEQSTSPPQAETQEDVTVPAEETAVSTVASESKSPYQVSDGRSNERYCRRGSRANLGAEKQHVLQLTDSERILQALDDAEDLNATVSSTPTKPHKPRPPAATPAGRKKPDRPRRHNSAKLSRELKPSRPVSPEVPISDEVDLPKMFALMLRDVMSNGDTKEADEDQDVSLVQRNRSIAQDEKQMVALDDFMIHPNVSNFSRVMTQLNDANLSVTKRKKIFEALGQRLTGYFVETNSSSPSGRATKMDPPTRSTSNNHEQRHIKVKDKNRRSRREIRHRRASVYSERTAPNILPPILTRTPSKPGSHRSVSEMSKPSMHRRHNSATISLHTASSPNMANISPIPPQQPKSSGMSIRKSRSTHQIEGGKK